MKNNDYNNMQKKMLQSKSLKDRIRFIVNLSIIIAIILLSFLFVFSVNRGINVFGKQASNYYVDQIQLSFTRLTEKDTDHATADDFINNKLFIMNMDNLFNIFPIFSVNIKVDDQTVYYINSTQIINKFIHSNTIVNNNDLTQIDNTGFKGTKTVEALYSSSGDEIGEISIGIDNAFLTIIYIILIIIVAVAGFLVSLIMKVITAKITKPILKPIYQLQKQMNQLADENYENINPTVTISKYTVSEVRDLSDSMNKLLGKMINYNEIITQSEKMASVGQLTAAITHEINTPLGVINSNAGIMKILSDQAIKSSEEERKDLLITIHEAADTSEEACNRIQKIIKSLRLYSRIDQSAFMPSSINESLKSVITLTTNLHKNRIVIVEKLNEIPDVYCFIGLINQVFMNLIINAIQSIHGEGTITIETTCDDTFVYIKVKDTGCGISKKNIYRVFEYGFTTKQPGSGSGIGLALSKNIVHKHNGEILVDSIEGEGATMTVKLPINQIQSKEEED